MLSAHCCWVPSGKSGISTVQSGNRSSPTTLKELFGELINIEPKDNIQALKYNCTNILLFLLVLAPSSYAQAPPAREYQVKAVFLFNFSQFVEWPPVAFVSNDQPFVIGILGNDPFGAYLDETVKGEKMTGHTISVQRYGDVEDINDCHILFVNAAMASSGKLDSLKRTNMLLVSDADGFALSGGMIQFVTEKGKIRLQVNLNAIKSANLNISSKLLRLAEIIEDQQEDK